MSQWLELQGFTAEVLQTAATPDMRLKRRSPIFAFGTESLLTPGYYRKEAHAISVMGIFDSAYPERLRQIPDPPLLLYCFGHASVLGYHSASVVGARKCSIAGKEVASCLGRGLAELGCTVISGLALGIDSAAHRGALAAKAGATVAVLGGGFDHLYPTQNKNLAESIVTSNGMLI